MKLKIMLVAIVFSSVVSIASAAEVSTDTFGNGANQFTIDFVTISGDNGNLGSWNAGYTFSGVNHGDYRMGRLEISNDQWNKFQASYGAVTGSPSYTYDESPYFTGINVPINNVSWYEAAQFVNWLNTSTGHQPAYKFTGTQGKGDYTMAAWNLLDNGYDASNPFRNRNAKYFLPTEDEWVKAAYWNGTSLQTYATKLGESLTQGYGISGTGWNYTENDPYGPWEVGSGSEELNGTFDMMGNMWEWMESPYYIGDYLFNSNRSIRGGAYYNHVYKLSSSARVNSPIDEYYDIGFRVASVVPEPTSLILLGVGGLMLRRRKA